jgi:hypothetical protein
MNAPKTGINQSNTSLFSNLLVFLILLNCFARLCCFEEKSNRFTLTETRLHFVPHKPSNFCANTD